MTTTSPIPRGMRFPSGCAHLWEQHGTTFSPPRKRKTAMLHFWRHCRDRGATGNDLPLPFWLHDNLPAAIAWRMHALDRLCSGWPVYTQSALRRKWHKGNRHPLLAALVKWDAINMPQGYPGSVHRTNARRR